MYEQIEITFNNIIQKSLKKNILIEKHLGVVEIAFSFDQFVL